MVEYHPISAQNLSRLHQFGNNAYQEYSWVTFCMREESGKETSWSQTSRNWNRWTHLNSMLGNLMQRELQPIQGDKFIFPIADGTVKLSGGGRFLRTREKQGNLREESDGSPPEDSSPGDGEARNDFWSISGNYLYRHHVEPRVKLYVPREASFPIPLRYIDVTRASSTTLDVLLERRIDDSWNIDGAPDPPDSWTGSSRFTLLEETHPDGYTWSGGRLTKKQMTSRPDHSWPEIWKKMSEAAQRKEKQKWAIEKPKLDNAKRLRGIYFIDPADDIIKSVEKVGSSDASSNALQDQGRKVQGNLSHSWCSQDKIRTSLKPTNQRESVWRELYTQNMMTRATSTTLDVLLERRIDDYRNVERDRNLSDASTGFSHDSQSWMKTTPDGKTWSGERLTQKQTSSKPDNLWPEIWNKMSDAAHRKEQRKWAIEKPNLDNAKRLRNICCIDPADAELKKKKTKRVGNSDANGCALQDQGKIL